MEPKIRLKGFRGEWKRTTIGNIASVVGGGTPSTSNPLYWNGTVQWFTPSEVGHIKYVDKSERTITKDGIEGSSARIIPANSLLLSSRATIGESSINLCECTTNQGFQSLIPNNVDLEFLYSMMITKKNDLIRESNGSTFLEISASKVRSINICIPEKNEQKALGAYFQHLDSLIQSATKKIESLKQVKAASLQSMFPQEGKTTPRVRFKRFEGEWEKVSLKKFAKRITRKNKNMESTLALTISSIDGLVSQIDYFNNLVVGANLANYYLLKNGEFAYNKSYSRGYPFGSVKRLDRYDQGILSTLYIVFNINDEISSDYLTRFFDTTLWHKQVAERAEEGARNHGLLNIGADDFLTIYIVVPKSLEEQQKIADYFANLDSQISLQTQRLEKLKQIKSACLDNMFV